MRPNRPEIAPKSKNKPPTAIAPGDDLARASCITPRPRRFDLDVDDDDAKKTMISQLHKLLRPFVLRRLKADVERSMPPKTETILFASLTKCQRDVYKSLLKRDASLLGKEDGSCSGRRSRTSPCSSGSAATTLTYFKVWRIGP